jgi:hypothetical protein
MQFIYMPDMINAMSTLLLKLPFSRRYSLLPFDVFRGGLQSACGKLHFMGMR